MRRLLSFTSELKSYKLPHSYDFTSQLNFELYEITLERRHGNVRLRKENFIDGD
jgi:hypothetical protein